MDYDKTIINEGTLTDYGVYFFMELALEEHYRPLYDNDFEDLLDMLDDFNLELTFKQKEKIGERYKRLKESDIWQFIDERDSSSYLD